MGKRILHVSNLPVDTRARELAREFERYGPITRCDVPLPRRDARTAYAFVEYEDYRDANDAYERLHGKSYRGGSMRIEWAKSRRDGDRRGGSVRGRSRSRSPRRNESDDDRKRDRSPRASRSIERDRSPRASRSIERDVKSLDRSPRNRSRSVERSPRNRSRSVERSPRNRSTSPIRSPKMSDHEESI